MGLVYNNKNKLDIEILSEEKLEKNEAQTLRLRYNPRKP